MGWTTEKTKDFTPALESGTLNGYGVPTDNPARVRTADFTNVYIASCQVQFDNQDLYCNVFQYNVTTESFVTSSGWKKGNYSFNLSTARKIKVIFSKNAGGTTPMDVGDVTGFKISADFGGIQWSQDGSTLCGFPYLTETGVADEFAGTNSPWTLDGTVWGFPHIRRAGIADKYPEGGFSNLYRGARNARLLYLGEVAVKRAYLGREIVFEKG